jgi:hypothetical protein
MDESRMMSKSGRTLVHEIKGKLLKCKNVLQRNSKLVFIRGFFFSSFPDE